MQQISRFRGVLLPFERQFEADRPHVSRIVTPLETKPCGKRIQIDSRCVLLNKKENMR